jgi:hypothetical protein
VLRECPADSRGVEVTVLPGVDGEPLLCEHMFATVEGMTPRQLEELAERQSRLVHAVLYLPHPADSYDSWRKRWGGVVDLVAEINRMVSVDG